MDENEKLNTQQTKDNGIEDSDSTVQIVIQPQQNLTPPSGIVMEKYNNGFKPKRQLTEAELKIQRYIVYAVIIVVAYIVGFGYFLFNLEYENEYPTAKTDAIITLTGETKRITDSIAELAKGLSPRLFISGVHLQAPIEKVISKTITKLQTSGKTKISSEALKSRIEAGRAENTIENALESAIWVKRNNIHDARIITSFYHLPRVKLLFDKYLPNTTKIYHPITFAGIGKNPFKNPQIFMLVFSEYNKYLITYLWILSGIETNTAIKIQGVISK